MKFPKLVSSGFTSVCVVGALVFSAGAVASEGEAREVFSLAGSGAVTFSGARVVEDVSLVFLHFTPEGRSALIAELERTGLVAEALGKKASVRGDMPVSAIQVRRRVGREGLDEYEATGEMRLQWSRCQEEGRCVAAGSAKKVKVTGVVVQSVINGRPAYRVNAIRYEGGS